MNFSFPTWTQNQKLVLSGLLSIVVSALSTALTAVVQQYTLNGLDIPVLVNVAVITFMPALGVALYGYIPPHALQIMQSLQDTGNQAQANLQGLQQQHTALAIAAVQAKQPVIPAPVPMPVQQVPFPQPQQDMTTSINPQLQRSWGDTGLVPAMPTGVQP